MNGKPLRQLRCLSIVLVAMVPLGCNPHERVRPARVATAWQTQQRRQTEATEPHSDSSHDGQISKPDVQTTLNRSAVPAIATVNGRDIPRQRIVETLLRSHGVDLLVQIIALDAAEALAGEKGLRITKLRVDDEYDRALRRLVDPLPSITTGPFDRREAERLLDTILAERNMSREEYEIIIRRNAYLRAIVESEQVFAEDQLWAEFARTYGQRVQVRHIQLATPADVTRVTDRLAAGEEFGELASRYSANVASARTQGLLEPFSASDEQVPRLLRDVAYSLELGEVSAAARIGSWYHLVRLERRIPAEEWRFEQVRDHIERRLRDRLANPAMQQLYERLFKEADVAIHDPVLREAYTKQHPRGSN